MKGWFKDAVNSQTGPLEESKSHKSTQSIIETNCT